MRTRRSLALLILAATACSPPTRPHTAVQVTLDKETCLGSAALRFFVDEIPVGSTPMTPGYPSPSYRTTPGPHTLVAAVEPAGEWPPAHAFPPIAVDVIAGQTTQVTLRCGQ